MKTVLLLLVSALLFAGDTLPVNQTYHPNKRTANPLAMKPGDYACVFGFTASKEKHIWVWPDSFTYDPACHLYLIQKTRDGWKLWLASINIAIEGTDAEKKNLGALRITEIVP